MYINIFNHPYKADVSRQLESITQKFGMEKSITVIHSRIVLPFLPFSGSELGSYARSIEVPFLGKCIVLNCQRFQQEEGPIKPFILGRQVALFDKPSRYLHTPLAATVVAIGVVASSILFSSPLALIGITTLVATSSANFIAKREQENEKYADLAAFRNCTDGEKKGILEFFRKKGEEEANNPRSFLKNSFSSYPSYTDRYDQLVKDKTVRIELKNLYPSTDIEEEPKAN